MIYELGRWLALITGWPAQLLLFKKKVYFEIGRQIIIDEQKNTLDELTVGFYLQKIL